MILTSMVVEEDAVEVVVIEEEDVEADEEEEVGVDTEVDIMDTIHIISQHKYTLDQIKKEENQASE
jgi:hypothetical protein